MLTALKSNLRWIIISAIACTTAFAAGRASKSPQEIIQVEEKIVEKVVEKIVEVERNRQQKVTKVVQKPDGTTMTTIIDTNTQVSVSEKDTAAEINKETGITDIKTPTGDTYRPKYSAGVEATTDFKSLDTSYRVTAGYRLLGNAWLSGSYDIKRNELSAGIRLDF